MKQRSVICSQQSALDRLCVCLKIYLVSSGIYKIADSRDKCLSE